MIPSQEFRGQAKTGKNVTYNKDALISVIYHMHLGWKHVKEMVIFE